MAGEVVPETGGPGPQARMTPRPQGPLPPGYEDPSKDGSNDTAATPGDDEGSFPWRTVGWIAAGILLLAALLAFAVVRRMSSRRW